MTRNELEVFFQKKFDRMLSIMKAKNADYCGGVEAGKDDALKNFKVCEAAGIANAKIGILVRITDKIARAGGLIASKDEAQVKDESVADTLLDLCNYTILLMALMEDEEKKAS